MRTRSKSLILLIFAAAIVLFMYKDEPAQTGPTSSPEKVAAPKGQVAAPDIAYTVAMTKPWTHLIEVQMRLRWNQMPDKIELKMPVWTPGSYLIREYARHVQDFAVANGAGKELTWQKLNKNTWQVDTAGAKEIVAEWEVSLKTARRDISALQKAQLLEYVGSRRKGRYRRKHVRTSPL